MTKAMMKVKGCLQIQEEVLQELKWDSRVDATKIGVTVHEGVVKLTGQVDNYAEKLAAQDAAHRVAGALDVANDLQVAAPGHLELTDTDIAQAVRRALEWDVWVQDERIQSTVADGWVTLDGSVDLLRQADDAERAIRRLEGVRGVTNKIIVIGQKLSEEEVRGMIEDALERRAEREARRIKITVDDGKLTLHGWVRSWAEKRAILGAAGHAPGVKEVKDDIFIDPLF